MFKRLLILFSFLLLFNIFTVPSAKAESGCCVLKIPVTVNGLVFKSWTYGKPRDPERHTKVSAEACRKPPYTTTVGYFEGGTFNKHHVIKRGMYSNDLSKTCGKAQDALSSYSNSFCCVQGKGIVGKLKSAASSATLGLYKDPYSKDKAAGTLSCSPVPNTQTSCTGGNLEKRNCHFVAACAQSAKAYKQSLDTAEFYKKELDRIKARILETPPPTLGTDFPGNEKLGKIEVIDGAGQGSKSNDSGITYIAIPWIGQLIKWFYRYAIGIGGIVATVMIMVGGFIWILSGGDAGRVSEAKKIIKNASLGLILLMTAYMILNFINPDLVNLRSIYIEVPSIALRQGNFPECQVAVNDPQMQNVNGNYYCANFNDANKYVNLADPAIRRTIPNVIPPGRSVAYVTKPLYQALKGASADLKKLNSSYKFRISSASRSQNSQAKYCNCWKSFELSKFKVCPAGCGSCNYAGLPNCKGSGHKKGQALDIGLKGTGLNCGSLSMHYNCATHVKKTGKVKSILSKKNNCKDPKYKKCQDIMHNTLKKHGFTGISNEWWHHNYFKSSYSAPGGSAKPKK